MLLLLGFALLGAAVLVMSFGLRTDAETKGVGRSLAVLEAMTSAPQELTEELDKPFDERVLQPLLDRFQSAGRRLSGNDSAEKIRRKLDLAGNPAGWTVDRVTSGKVVGAIGGFAAGLLLDALFQPGFVMKLVVLAAATGVGFMAPNFYLYQRAYDRTETMQRALPDAIDLLTISVESGLGFDAALQQVAANTHGPLADEFSRVLREMQIGQGRAEALRGLAERTNVADLKTFVGAMVQADSFGIPIASVLRVQSAEIRVKRRQRAETKAQQVPVKMTVPLIFCVLPCLFIAVIGPAAVNMMRMFLGS